MDKPIVAQKQCWICKCTFPATSHSARYCSKACVSAMRAEKYASNKQYRDKVKASAAKRRTPVSEETPEQRAKRLSDKKASRLKNKHKTNIRRRKSFDGRSWKRFKSARQKHLESGRLGCHGAWKDWLSIAPVEWIDSFYADKPWLDHRLSRSKRDTIYWKHKYRTDPAFAAMERVKSQVKKLATGKRKSTYELVGYCSDQLRDHIFSLFDENMNEEAFLNGEIHIDHIIPKSVFNHLDEAEIKDCWSFENLRPMWGEDNMKKRNRACASEADPVLWTKYGCRITQELLQNSADWKKHQ